MEFIDLFLCLVLVGYAYVPHELYYATTALLHDGISLVVKSIKEYFYT